MVFHNAGSIPSHLADFTLQELSLFLLFVFSYDLSSPTLPVNLCWRVLSFFPPEPWYVCLPCVSRPKKLTLKGYKQYWCTFKDITISCYKSKEEALGTPAHQMNLRGAEIQTYLKCYMILIMKREGLFICFKHVMVGGVLKEWWKPFVLISRLLRLWGNARCEYFWSEIQHQIANPCGRRDEWDLASVWHSKAESFPQICPPSVALFNSIVVLSAGETVRSLDGSMSPGLQREDHGWQLIQPGGPEHSLLPQDATHEPRPSVHWTNHHWHQPRVSGVSTVS